MSGPTAPQLLLEAIAAAAGGGFITNPMPENPTGTNAASIKGGFPPITMQSELSGGKPPLGQDVNGFMNLITQHTLWVESGQLYKFSSTLATAIGGYPVGTVLAMSDGAGAWVSVADANSNDPDAGGSGWVPYVTIGSVTVPVSGGTVNLTPAQTRFNIIILTGALASNLTVNLPETIQQWLIINNTTGAFSVTVKTAAGGSVGVAILQGGFAAPVGVYSVGDGNIYPTVAPLSVPIDQNPTPSTLVERTNTGVVTATFFNGNAGFENPSLNGVIVLGADQATFRKMTPTNFEAQLLLQGIGGQVTNGQVPFSVVAQWASALFTSPAFTGTPTAPTAAPGTSNTQVATTAFVNQAQSIVGNGYVKFSSGLILQWGTGPNTGGGGSPIISTNIAFPNNFFGVVAMNDAHPTQANGKPLSLSTFQLFSTGGTAFWIALGN